MVDINQVYETVLTVLNKEQRGYLDAEEFNNLARQVQREIFESYFNKDYRAELAQPYPGEYGDPSSNTEEKINVFQATSDAISEVNNMYPYPTDFYRLGSIVGANGKLLDEVNKMKIAHINHSHLTKPTEQRPVFTRVEGGVKVYPNTLDIYMDYLKVPTDPVWGFNETLFISNNEIVYDPTVSENFELHPSEFQELVVRILSYAGVVVRDQIVQQAAMQKEQVQQATEQ